MRFENFFLGKKLEKKPKYFSKKGLGWDKLKEILAENILKRIEFKIFRRISSLKNLYY